MLKSDIHIVVDLGFGDQGKGSITDFLVRDRGAELVVRYNGGAQAAHRVVTDDGRRHVFAQLGAGSFVPGVETLLARCVAVSPWALLVEADHLARQGVAYGLARTFIDARAPIITPFHAAANRLRERARGDARHGSCGIGVGETVADARTLGPENNVRAADLADVGLVARLARIQARKRTELAEVITAVECRGPDPDVARDIALLTDPDVASACEHALHRLRDTVRVLDGAASRKLLQERSRIVFEGAQGVLLDEDHGFHPHTTWSRCTSHQAMELLHEAGRANGAVRLGVLRAYATRHGAGPFPTEDPGWSARLPEPNDFDSMNPWQGAFRVGPFDTLTARYAMAANDGIDALALTCVDRVAGWSDWRYATGYRVDGAEVDAFHLARPADLAAQETLGRWLGRARPRYVTCPGDQAVEVISALVHPVALVSRGPNAAAKSWRMRV
jgi:adenylosuccinate synthase